MSIEPDDGPAFLEGIRQDERPFRRRRFKTFANACEFARGRNDLVDWWIDVGMERYWKKQGPHSSVKG